ncbi:MAG: hypothetical protein IPM26_14275 [Saprospiraceae bacterium]|nr:hypothetical protein [Saprospiraceae bacterium]
MGLNKIYTIQSEKVSIEVKDYMSLPDTSNYNIAYVGKHKAIIPGEAATLADSDMEKDLLIECRLFNDKEEIYIFPVGGVVKQRTIKSGDGVDLKYVDKKIQLRSSSEQKDRHVCILRQYLDDNGYTIQRYIKIE